MLYSSFRKLSGDFRRTHCIICKEKIENWEAHVLSSRHVALRALGNHFYSYNPPKSKHLFESSLQSALGISSSILARERKPINAARCEYLKSLLGHLLHNENFSMKFEEKNVKAFRGSAILRKEATLLVFRLHPKWGAMQVQAFVDTIITNAHLEQLTHVLSIDPDFFDLEAAVGHFHSVLHEKPDEIVLQTLTKHAIHAIVFELYILFVWDSMNHLTTVWEIYLSTRKTIVEEVQKTNRDEMKLNFEHSPQKCRGNLCNIEPIAMSWALPKACVSYQVSGPILHQKLQRIDRVPSLEKGKSLTPSTLKSSMSERCYPLIQTSKKRIAKQKYHDAAECDLANARYRKCLSDDLK